jgi:hypothetical protein
MFGYDRDALLLRLFMPLPLFNLFCEMSLANQMLIRHVGNRGLEGVQVLTTSGFRPTRHSVVDGSKYDMLVGGIDYFPPNPVQASPDELDSLLADYEGEGYYELPFDKALRILATLAGDEYSEWLLSSYMRSLEVLASQPATQLPVLIVRRGRDISRGTGTLLSQTDRRLGQGQRDRPVVTLYRLNGQQQQGWNGHPFWVPNLRLPERYVFHETE